MPAGNRSVSIRSPNRALPISMTISQSSSTWISHGLCGARRGFQAVASTLVNKGDSVIVSALAHYTEFLAVENAGGIVREVPLNAQNLVTAEATAEKIEEVKTGTENSRFS